MNLREWNKRQIRQIRAEALGKDNRYFFWKEHNREAYSEDELIIHWVTRGGALKFRRENEESNQDLR